MAEEVQEQMGDILRAFDIPELADHIVPIHTSLDDEEEGEPSRNSPPEQSETEESKEVDEDEDDDTMDIENTAAESTNKETGAKPEQGEKTDDNETPMDTEDDVSASSSTSTLEPLPAETSDLPGTSSTPDAVTTGQTNLVPQGLRQPADQSPPHSLPDLGLTQSAVSLLGNKPGSEILGQLLTSTTKPVMTPVQQGTTPQATVVQGIAGQWSSPPPPAAAASEHNIGTCTSDELPIKAPSVLTSVDEFNSYFDRCKEVRELIQMKGEILSKANQVGAYKCPRLSEEQSSALGMSMEVFECPGCGDTFLFKASLDAHSERKTVLITFRCKWCTGRQYLVFYNKCNFLAHLYGHNASDSDISAARTQATVTPVNSVDSLKIFTKLSAPTKVISSQALDVSQARKSGNVKPRTIDSMVVPSHATTNVIKQEVTRTDTTVELSSTDSDESNNDNGEVIINQQPRLAPKTTASQPTCSSVNSTTYSPHCIACGKKFLSKEFLKQHLQAVVSRAALMQCQICKMVLGNSCKLRMHTIIHRQSIPVQNPCPECGLVAKTLKDLFEHQHKSCLHWMRRPLFKCTFCLKYATSFHGLKRHFESNHIDVFYKCTLCQLAFRNNEAAMEHSLQVHRIKSVTYGLLYKCPFCKSVYSARTMLEKHFEVHFKDGVIKIEKFVYSCHQCNKPFDHVSSLHSHFLACHQKSTERIFNCDICLLTFASVEQVLVHRFTCARINLSGTSGHKTSVNPEVKSPVAKTRSPPGGANPPKVFMCGECGVKFPEYNIEALRTHMIEKHASKFKAAATTQGPLLKPTPSGPARSSQTSVVVGSYNQTQPVQSQQPVTLIIRKPESIKVERFTDLQCAKCDHKRTDRIEFEKHIISHKMNDLHSQCHQCGLCFTVEESLRKHMFIKHKIKNMAAFEELRLEVVRKGEEEMKLKKQEDKEKMKKQDEKEKENEQTELSEKNPDTKPDAKEDKAEEEEKDEDLDQEENKLKCRVCKAEFDSEKTFAVHKRSHGLAYLQNRLTTK